jgi:hypothetical protein
VWFLLTKRRLLSGTSRRVAHQKCTMFRSNHFTGVQDVIGNIVGKFKICEQNRTDMRANQRAKKGKGLQPPEKGVH